ncbi:uncharacterized protein ACNLHF_017878 isoform 1-T1 [Anomaloglossus baeobatrachus]
MADKGRIASMAVRLKTDDVQLKACLSVLLGDAAGISSVAARGIPGNFWARLKVIWGSGGTIYDLGQIIGAVTTWDTYELMLKSQLAVNSINVNETECELGLWESGGPHRVGVKKMVKQSFQVF